MKGKSTTKARSRRKPARALYRTVRGTAESPPLSRTTLAAWLDRLILSIDALDLAPDDPAAAERERVRLAATHVRFLTDPARAVRFNAQAFALIELGQAIESLNVHASDIPANYWKKIDHAVENKRHGAKGGRIRKADLEEVRRYVASLTCKPREVAGNIAKHFDVSKETAKRWKRDIQRS